MDNNSKLSNTINDLYYFIDCMELLRTIEKSGSCNDCAKQKNCDYDPGIGKLVRYNCPFYKRREDE